VTTVGFVTYAYGVRADIEMQDPVFARGLYRSGGELFWHRGLPIRGHILLFGKTSAIKRTTLLPLQIWYCLNTILFVVAFVVIVIAV
jgi:hypothetical protein